MKKIILVLLAVVLLAGLSVSTSDAFTYMMDSPFTYSYLDIITNFNNFGDHAVITYNSEDNFGSFFGVILDNSGTPVRTAATYGYFYLFGDVRADGGLNIYGSDTGLWNDWHLLN